MTIPSSPTLTQTRNWGSTESGYQKDYLWMRFHLTYMKPPTTQLNKGVKDNYTTDKLTWTCSADYHNNSSRTTSELQHYVGEDYKR